jgi:YhcH/YjgK/YiaL family protein
MIHDRIENMNLYLKGNLLSELKKAISSLAENQPDGNYPLQKDDIFFKVLRYETKESDWITESHQKYIDIQLVLSGVELIKIYDRSKLVVLEDYNSETDNIFYNTDDNLAVSEIKLMPGFFCLFFPDDVHQTQIADHKGSQLITKLVFKVHEKFFA